LYHLNLKNLPGFKFITVGSNDPSLASQFKWSENTFNIV
jgi:hypothetical protein